MEKYLRTVSQDPASQAPSPSITLAPKTLSFGPSHTKKLKSPDAAHNNAAATQKSRKAAADTAAAAATAARTVNEALDQFEDSLDNQPSPSQQSNQPTHVNPNSINQPNQNIKQQQIHVNTHPNKSTNINSANVNSTNVNTHTNKPTNVNPTNPTGSQPRHQERINTQANCQPHVNKQHNQQSTNTTTNVNNNQPTTNQPHITADHTTGENSEI
jgi:hypothetical protein